MLGTTVDKIGLKQWTIIEKLEESHLESLSSNFTSTEEIPIRCAPNLIDNVS